MKNTPTPARVRRALKSLDLTQAEAARRIGKSEAMVSMVLRGKAKSRPILLALDKLILRASTCQP